jgi:hypothetical protein
MLLCSVLTIDIETVDSRKGVEESFDAGEHGANTRESVVMVWRGGSGVESCRCDGCWWGGR